MRWLTFIVLTITLCSRLLGKESAADRNSAWEEYYKQEARRAQAARDRAAAAQNAARAAREAEQQRQKAASESGSSTDSDKDGIVDSEEYALLKLFAPKIWLHHDENRWPVNIEWFLGRVTMRYSHPKCHDCEIIRLGDVTSANITEQTHQNTAFKNIFSRCHHSGPKNRSDGYTAEPKKSFFLQFPNDNDHNGTTDKREWVLYGHVYPIADGCLVIQYWQLYAYNDSISVSNHEGDWEMSGLIVGKERVPLRVFHYGHGGTKEIAPQDAQWEGTHHISYSAKGGHAQYPASETGRIGDSCGQGTAWNSWEEGYGGIINVGERDAPLNTSNWLRYSGRWGEIGVASTAWIKFTSGPQGPAYQKGWNWRR